MRPRSVGLETGRGGHSGDSRAFRNPGRFGLPSDGNAFPGDLAVWIGVSPTGRSLRGLPLLDRPDQGNRPDLEIRGILRRHKRMASTRLIVVAQKNKPTGMTAVIDSLKRPLKDFDLDYRPFTCVASTACRKNCLASVLPFSKEEILTYEEINRAVEAFAAGNPKIRITGENHSFAVTPATVRLCARRRPIWTWRSRPTGWDSMTPDSLAKPVLTASTPALMRSIRQSPGK